MTARHLETRIHPDDRIDPDKAGPQAMRHVTVNVAEWIGKRIVEDELLWQKL